MKQHYYVGALSEVRNSEVIRKRYEGKVHVTPRHWKWAIIAIAVATCNSPGGRRESCISEQEEGPNYCTAIHIFIG